MLVAGTNFRLLPEAHAQCIIGCYRIDAPGPPGSQGPPGPQGPAASLSTQEVQSDFTQVAPGGLGRAAVQCPAGSNVVTGGGFGIGGDIGGAIVVNNQRQSPNGWGVTVDKSSGGVLDFVAVAECATTA